MRDDDAGLAGDSKQLGGRGASPQATTGRSAPAPPAPPALRRKATSRRAAPLRRCAALCVAPCHSAPLRRVVRRVACVLAPPLRAVVCLPAPCAPSCACPPPRPKCRARRAPPLPRRLVFTPALCSPPLCTGEREDTRTAKRRRAPAPAPAAATTTTTALTAPTAPAAPASGTCGVQGAGGERGGGAGVAARAGRGGGRPFAETLCRAARGRRTPSDASGGPWRAQSLRAASTLPPPRRPRGRGGRCGGRCGPSPPSPRPTPCGTRPSVALRALTPPFPPRVLLAHRHASEDFSENGDFDVQIDNQVRHWSSSENARLRRPRLGERGALPGLPPGTQGPLLQRLLLDIRRCRVEYVAA